MTQAPGREEDVVDTRSRWMTTEPRAIPVERAQVLLGQLAKRPERHIIRPGGVPLGKDKLVGWTKTRWCKVSKRSRHERLPPICPTPLS